MIFDQNGWKTRTVHICSGDGELAYDVDPNYRCPYLRHNFNEKAIHENERFLNEGLTCPSIPNFSIIECVRMCVCVCKEICPNTVIEVTNYTVHISTMGGRCITRGAGFELQMWIGRVSHLGCGHEAAAFCGDVPSLPTLSLFNS